MTKRHRIAAAILLTGTVLAIASCTGSPEPADLVLRNGDITTLDAGLPQARAIAVKGGAIAAVCASDEEAERW
ncbi:MAG: hypothetical protein H6P95_1236, partial [Candidatus Aminicenantes bacterium]|nr:hypothetical protein [Candidatus Aminicenantes bacterium]